MAASPLACEAQTVWTDKWRHDDAECKYQMSKHGVTPAVMNEVKKQVIKEYGKITTFKGLWGKYMSLKYLLKYTGIFKV